MRSSVKAIIASVVTAIAIGAPIGVWQGGVISGGGGGGSPQTFYISPSGSDSNPGTSGSPFATMSKCYQAATEGNGNSTTPTTTCFMQDGSYGDQTILWSVHKPISYTCRWGGPFLTGTASGGTTTESRDLSGCIKFTPVNAGAVSATSVTVQAPYVYLEGLTINGARDGSQGSLNSQNDASHSGTDCGTATFTDIIVRNTTMYFMFITGVEHMYLINDTFDSQATAGHSAVTGCTNVGGYGGGEGQNHLMIDGTTIKNQYWQFTGQHLEGIQWTACDICTLQNSRFLNDAQFDISFAFGNGGDNSGNHMLIQNNVFDHTCSHQNFAAGGGCDSTANGGEGNGAQEINIGCPSGCSSQHWLIRFNSFDNIVVVSPDNYYGCDCAGGVTGDFLSEGNVAGGMQSGFRCGTRQSQGFTFDHEVYTVGPTCGTNNSYNNTPASVYTNDGAYDFTIKSCSTSASANFVPTSVTGGVPPTDINGNPRPSGTNADAGAYEQCS